MTFVAIDATQHTSRPPALRTLAMADAACDESVGFAEPAESRDSVSRYRPFLVLTRDIPTSVRLPALLGYRARPSDIQPRIAHDPQRYPSRTAAVAFQAELKHPSVRRSKRPFVSSSF